MKSLKSLFVIYIALAGLSCKSIQVMVPNVVAHIPMSSGGAFTKELNTGVEGYLDKDAWSRIEVGMFCHTPEDMGRLIAVIEKACANKQVKCTQEEIDAVNDSRDLVNSVTRLKSRGAL